MSGVTSIPSIEDKTRLHDVMDPFGLSKSCTQAEDFETDPPRQVRQDLNMAIYEGGIVAWTGIVGRGKSVLLVRLPPEWRTEGQLELADSLPFHVQRVHLDTLQRALYDDLATEQDGEITRKTEKSERAWIRVMRRCPKPIVLLVEDGHDLPAPTLRGLQPRIEKTGRRGVRLTIV